MSREKRSKVLFVGVLATFIVVVLNQFVLSDETAEPPIANEAAASSPSRRKRDVLRQAVFPRSAASTEVESEPGYRPLPLNLLRAKRAIDEKPLRHLFTYYVPPPKPPEPVPLPPLAIHAVEPVSVYAGTKEFTLRVSGANLPEEARIFLNGQALSTKRTNASTLSATVEKRLFATPGQLPVEVKDLSGELYSNPLMISVKAPPTPPYKYVGRIDNLIFLEKSEQERFSVRLGGVVENRWRVVKLGQEKVALEDVTLGLQHTVAMPPPAPWAPAPPPYQPPHRIYQPPVRRVPQPIRPQPNQNRQPQPNQNRAPQAVPRRN